MAAKAYGTDRKGPNACQQFPLGKGVETGQAEGVFTFNLLNAGVLVEALTQIHLLFTSTIMKPTVCAFQISHYS